MFTRRALFAAAMAMTALPAFAQNIERPWVSTDDVQALLDAGDTVFVDFKATWCGTCKVQERQIDAILTEDPSLMDQIKFVNVDWDEYGEDDFTKSLNIPRRSTLVLFDGRTEIGRLVAITDRDQIFDLIDMGLE